MELYIDTLTVTLKHFGLFWISQLVKLIEKINIENFNLYLLNSDSHSGTEEFFNTLGSYFFNPHILRPTRITHHSATLIDNVFINSITRHTISGSIVYDLTDHLPNFLIVNKFTTLPKGFKIFKRDFTHFNEQNFLQDI